MLLIILFFHVCYFTMHYTSNKNRVAKTSGNRFPGNQSQLFRLETYRAAATEQQPWHHLIYTFVHVIPENYWQPAQLWNKERETSPSAAPVSGVLTSCSFQPKLQTSQQDQLWKKRGNFLFLHELICRDYSETPLLLLTLCPVWWATVTNSRKFILNHLKWQEGFLATFLTPTFPSNNYIPK